MRARFSEKTRATLDEGGPRARAGQGRIALARASVLASACVALVTAGAAAQEPTPPGDEAREAATPAEPPPTYDAVIDSAVTEFSAEHWQEAQALFSEAHALYPNARTLRGLGMTSYELRDYPRAVRELEASLVETRRALTEEQHAQVDALLEQARGFIGRLLVPAAPAGARVYVDGARQEIEATWPAAPGSIVVGVGEHVIEIRGEDGGLTSARVLVIGRSEGPLDIDLAPLSPAAPTLARRPIDGGTGAGDAAPSAGTSPSPVGWVVLATGIAGLAAGAVTGGLALDRYGALEARCGADHTCPAGFEGDRDTGASFAVATDALLVAGGLVAAAGVVLLFTVQDPAPVTAGAWCTDTGCTASIRGTL